MSDDLDLFAGAGGWEVGIAPLDVLPLGIEWNTDACTTREVAGHRTGHRDRAGGERQFTHAVRITLQEAAILQGFPPDYPFQGTRTAQFTQVGNAVPPPLAHAVIEALLDV